MNLREYVGLLELARTFFHVFSLLIFFLLYSFFLSKAAFLILLFSLLLLFSFLEYQKRESGSLGKIYLTLGKPFLRQSEKGRKLVGAVTVLLGCFLTALFFAKNIALTAILFLALGDPSSRIFRVLTKQRTFLGKINLGAIIMFLVCFLIATFRGFSLFASVISSILASFAEAVLEVKISRDFYLDDNFFVPLVSGLSLFLLSRVKF